MPLHALAQDAFLRVVQLVPKDDLAAWVVEFAPRLAELDRLARRESRRPAAQDDIERLDLPLVVGRVIRLYRPSVAGMHWLRTKASEWWGGNVRKYTLALAYVCAHREKDALELAQTRLAAAARIKAWAWGTHCGEEVLRRAALSLLPPPDDSVAWFAAPGDGGEDADVDLLAVAGVLAQKCGGSASHWLWEVSDDEFWGAYCGLMDVAEAEGDPKHESPSCWWRRQRRALAECERRLAQDTSAFAQKRAQEREEAARRAAMREEARKARKARPGAKAKE